MRPTRVRESVAHLALEIFKTTVENVTHAVG